MENTHRKYYNDKGEEVPSVTTVLKIFGKDLTGWANWMGKRGIDTRTYVAEKAEFGTYIHSLAERYFTGDLSVLKYEPTKHLSENDYNIIIDRFKYLEESFFKKGYTVYGSEIVLEGNEFGGTADLLFHNKETDKYILLDFKTSGSVYNSMFIQLGGYTTLFKEVKDIDISGLGIILIMKDINDKNFFNLKSSEDNKSYQEIFNYLSNIYYLLSESERNNLIN